MLRFTFDNDAIGHLVNSETFEEHRKNIEGASNRKSVAVHFSRTNLLEMVKGVKECNFQYLQRLLRQAYVLGGRRNLLLSPSHHLKCGLGQADQETVNQWYEAFYKDVRQMFGATDYREFHQVYGKASASLGRGNDAIWNAAKEVKQASLDTLDRERRKALDDRYLSDKSGSRFFDEMYPGLLQRFNLQDDIVDLDREEIVRRLPSLVQFCEVYRTLQRKRVIEGHNPQPGDFFDVERVIYLDLCDYIVSDDRRFRNLLNDAGTSDLCGRAIELEEFLEHLEHPMLEKRLTLPVGTESRLMWHEPVGGE